MQHVGSTLAWLAERNNSAVFRHSQAPYLSRLQMENATTETTIVYDLLRTSISAKYILVCDCGIVVVLRKIRVVESDRWIPSYMCHASVVYRCGSGQRILAIGSVFSPNKKAADSRF
jgi:hypothetical protein